MEETGQFYTLKGYQVKESSALTPAMEDYLEMICRLLEQGRVVRIGELAEQLHVKPSSASKMIELLRQGEFVDCQKYDYVRLTEKGRAQGQYLLYRHQVLQRFLCLLNHTANELEQVEKIEHFLNRQTVANLDALADLLEKAGETP